MRPGSSKTGKIQTGASRSVIRHGAPLAIPPTRGPYSARATPEVTEAPNSARSSSATQPTATSSASSSALQPTTPTVPQISTTHPQNFAPISVRQTLTIEQQGKLREIGLENRRRILQALDIHDRTTLQNSAYDADETVLDDYVDVPLGLTTADPEEDSDVEEVEAFDIVRAGQTYTVIVDEVKGASYVSRVKNNNRWNNRQTRLMKHQQAWAAQWDTLATEYLHWKHTSILVDAPPPLGDVSDEQLPNVAEIEAVGWHWHAKSLKYLNTGERFINQVLIRRGLLSPSPLIPSFAVSLLTLESFRCLRLRSPRLSVQAFVRSLCDTQGEVYRSFLYQEFSDAYDVYMEILRHVDQRVQTALHRDSPDWRLRNSCPPCQYRLEDEEPLEYDRLIAIDGGMSLKRFATAGSASSHLHFTSDYILPRPEVDKYQLKTKVKRRKGKGTRKGKGKGKGKEPDQPSLANANVKDKNPGSDHDSDDTDDNTNDRLNINIDIDPAEGAQDNDQARPSEEWVYKTVDSSPADVAGVISACVERWKANADDSKKGMFNCFEESGIFISVCRHGFILVTTDMVASGELAKYPLAILAKLQEVFPDAKLLTAYDIGCAFEKTAAKALGSTLHIRFVIPSMHGYAHNRACQLCYHPNYVSGTGLEDFESCERAFSHLNDVARTTRHATSYHRHQAIHHQMQQWDADKYLSLGHFLRNNYAQALSIMDNLGDYFAQLKVLKQLENNDFTNWLAEELAYLSNIGKEPEETALALEYVAALDKLWKAESDYEQQRKNIASTDAPDGDTGKRTVKITYKAAASKVTHCLGQVDDLEVELGLATRWEATSKEYIEAKERLAERKYRLALETLEKLVVQRLFELQKGYLENTGYKLRTLIAKHLKSRSEAIRTAVKAYNTAARSLKPPRPAVSFQTVIDYTFLGEFDMLKGTVPSIQSKPWADRNNRVLMDQYYKLVHAKEEVRRLNIEVRRLQTWIRDENAHYQAVATHVAKSDIPLSLEILHQALYKHRVNAHILKSLREIEGLSGFSGKRGPGTRLGHGGPDRPDDDSDPVGDGGLNDEEESEDDSELEIQVDGLDQVLSRMAV